MVLFAWVDWLNCFLFSASEQSGGSAKMTSSSLAAITALKKLVNHPDLIHGHCREKKEGFENALQHYPQVH